MARGPAPVPGPPLGVALLQGVQLSVSFIINKSIDTIHIPIFLVTLILSLLKDHFSLRLYGRWWHDRHKSSMTGLFVRQGVQMWSVFLSSNPGFLSGTLFLVSGRLFLGCKEHSPLLHCRALHDEHDSLQPTSRGVGRGDCQRRGSGGVRDRGP